MNQFAERLKSARVMAGLSLQDLAEKLQNQVTRQALHKYEKGEFMPDSKMIGLLCDALGVRQDYFYRKNVVELGEIEFRKYTRYSAKEKNSLIEKTRDVLSRYLELEEILNIDSRFRLSFKETPIRSNEQVEDVAIKLRTDWKLGTAPIFNLIELLEDHNIKVIEVESDDGVDGLSAWANHGQVPVIVLNNNKLKSLDRKRFTALHELAHLLMNFEGLTEKQKEKYCHYFAAAMLLPRETIKKEVGESRSKLLLPELGAIKKQYGISMQAIAYRLKDLGIISEAYFKQFMFFISQSGFKIEEPYPYEGQEKSRRFHQLLFRALGEELISMSKAASLNNQKLAEFRSEHLMVA
ncbi:MAG TPA: XRE family transcriptional regulator [Cyclobacteriaceae bacterium]|nr:XRE family transcriptional regulator [Cyclobacteriaceae bacterium]